VFLAVTANRIDSPSPERIRKRCRLAGAVASSITNALKKQLLGF
jgi:hypothetical protein